MCCILGLLAQNVILVGFLPLISQFNSRFNVGHIFRKRVFRVGASHRQEVFSVNEDTALLHNPEGSLGASLLHIPEEFVLNTLHRKLSKEFKLHCARPRQQQPALLC